MKETMERINDSTLSPQQRISALEAFVGAGGMQHYSPVTKEINNHIHTIYSFSPYTPSMAALRAREAGLAVAGSVDHDSLEAAQEMSQACRLLGLGCVTGFELRVSFKSTPFANKKINNPDSQGIVYMTIQGVPAPQRQRVAQFLEPIHQCRRNRNIRMVENLNKILLQAQLPILNYQRDVESLSQSALGGSVTERHILYAFAKLLDKEAGSPERLVQLLEETLALTLSPSQKQRLLEQDNPHYLYDLLGLLKSGFIQKIFIQPDDHECPPVQQVTAFAQSIGAVPAYAYLGDVGESPTGDKKREQFEDSFLDQLIGSLPQLGFLAVTYMPPRNTPEQLQRLKTLCQQHKLMEISGVDINSSRQSFNCPEINLPAFENLIHTTWALVAHEALASSHPDLGLFSKNNPMADWDLDRRIQAYSRLGQKLKSTEPLTQSKAEEILKEMLAAECKSAAQQEEP